MSAVRWLETCHSTFDKGKKEMPAIRWLELATRRTMKVTR